MNVDYQQQLSAKTEHLKELFSEFGELPNLEVFPSPPEHYRMRAEFRVWHDDEIQGRTISCCLRVDQQVNAHSNRTGKVITNSP